jgi:hypothetical protein
MADLRDCGIFVPSRGRAPQLFLMIGAVLDTASAATDVIVAVDDDDPDTGAYAVLEDGLHHEKRVIWQHGPRDSMAGWTTTLADRFRDRYHALASLGDDHFPRTYGWDDMLLDALATSGAPVAYGNDLHQGEKLPTAPLIPSRVVAALGWMCLPGCRHYFIDNAWNDLGPVYVPAVVIEHLHPDAGKARRDATYSEAMPHWADDEAAYRAWCGGRRTDDIAVARRAAAGL